MTRELTSLHVAVIGCGRMGAERAGQAASLGCNIVACVDTDGVRASALAAAHEGASAFSDEEPVRWQDLDAVFVCTPPSARNATVMRAIDARVAVMVEKPIGLSASEGAVLANAARHAGVINAVGYMNRYRQSVRHAKKLLAGRTVSAIMCHWACRPYGVPWWSASETSGGPFNEQATHLVDLCRFMAGEIERVEAYAAGGHGANGDATRVAVALRFASGAVGTLCYTCEAPDKFISFVAVTAAGALRLDGWDFSLTANTIYDSRSPAEPSVFETETGAFLRAAATNDQSLVASSFDDAVKTQSVVDAVRAAANS
jgi:myo-inositol 2-dehydrogenase/D-chiro-inositol 1-dehydrogenase